LDNIDKIMYELINSNNNPNHTPDLYRFVNRCEKIDFTIVIILLVAVLRILLYFFLCEPNDCLDTIISVGHSWRQDV